MQSEILSYFSALTNSSIGRLPENGGIVIQPAPSPAGEIYLDGSSSDNMSILFLCKNKNQRTALDTLEKICSKLTHIKNHPHGIYALHVTSQPNYVGIEGDFFIYSCVINLKFYNKEVF